LFSLGGRHKVGTCRASSRLHLQICFNHERHESQEYSKIDFRILRVFRGQHVGPVPSGYLMASIVVGGVLGIEVDVREARIQLQIQVGVLFEQFWLAAIDGPQVS